MNYTPMVDDTKSGILKHEADEAYRRLQQGFEALRPAFSCNRKVHYRTSATIWGALESLYVNGKPMDANTVAGDLVTIAREEKQDLDKM